MSHEPVAVRGNHQGGRRVARRLFVACSLVSLSFLVPADVESGKAGAQPVTAAPAATRPNLNITPKRVTLARGQRTATVYIFNQGTVPATFDISMVDRVMLPSGEIISADDARANPANRGIADRLSSAKGLIVAVPRRVVLAPGRGQTIRLRLTAPPPSDAGEIRSHLTVVTVPPRSTGLTAEEAAAAQQPERVSFQIAALFGVSIPVIVRPGPVDARAEIQNVRLAPSADGSTMNLSLDLNRLGPNSLFGNIEVRARGDRTLIGLARGVGVYPEVNQRAFQLPLQRRPVRGEQLEITYVDDDASPGRTIARASLPVP